MLKVTYWCAAICCILVTYKFVKYYFKVNDKTTMSLGTVQPTGSVQTVQFTESEENNSVPIVSEDVMIISSTGDHVTGSSKVKMNNIVDYSWEERYYTGQLLAVHRDGKYIAYGIKDAKSNCAIRVVNIETTRRALIKGVEGMIEDLAFAFIPNQVILASLDQFGNVLIHKIQENSVEITCSRILRISGDTIESHGPKRIFWCPYVPDEEAENSPDPYAEGLLLAVTRGTKIQMWRINDTLTTDQAGTSYSGGNLPGVLSIDAHLNIIVDAAFSPDGSAIATASHDGKCKFFQAYMHGEGRCLHEWEPHNGEPVTLLFFLDNYKSFDHETQFWKYAVTGAKDNCELKLWSCETWECIQTIRFSANNSSPKKLKAAIDLTAGYILLSDMYFRLLFVLELQKDTNETLPFVKSISEFKLPYPILSFGIVEAGPKTFKPNTSFTIEDLCNGEGEEESQVAVVIRMYLVQPKSLQECHIVFQPIANNISLPSKLSSISSDKLEKQEHLNDISGGLQDIDLSRNSNPPQQSQAPQPPLNLMTPDAFHSPSNKDSTINAHVGENKTTPLPDSTEAYSISNPAAVNNNESSAIGVGFVSGGSSPSREVQEILSSPCYYVPTRSPRAQHVMTSPPNITCAPEATTNNKLKEIENTIQSLKGDMTALTKALQKHSCEIQLLREELRTSNTNIEGTVLKAINDGTIKCGLNEDRLSTHLIKEVHSSIINGLLPQIVPDLNNSIKKEVNKTLNEVKELIHSEVSLRLTLADQVLKDNLNRLLRSKTMTELLTNSLTGAATVSMEKIYKDTFSKVAVPLIETACTNMFKQVNETLTNGLKEYVKETEEYSTKSNDRTNRELNSLQAATEQLSLTAQEFSSAVDNETKRLCDVVQELQRSMVGANLNNGSMRSGTATPAFTDPHLLQSQLSKIISQGQIDAAFQQALSASDLSLVIYVCESVPPNKVFTDEGCVLQQHVLLSLIQQLSADMSHHTDIKHKYLEEAVMNLDSNNLNTREHMPAVLRGLHKQLKAFLTANPNNRLSKNVRMLQMATQSLLTS